MPGNYGDVFSAVPFLRYTFNTMTVAFLSTVGVVLSSIPVAYALSRMKWRGRNVVFVLVLATLMLPYQVTALPLYVVFVKIFHWVPGLKPLIVPSFFGDAFSIFLLRQFFRSVPDDLADAARVDGASDWQIMTRVIVPLANRRSPPSRCSTSSTRGTTSSRRCCTWVRTARAGPSRSACPSSRPSTMCNGT